MTASSNTAAGEPVGGSATDEGKTSPDATDAESKNQTAANHDEGEAAASGERMAADGATVKKEPSQQEHHNPTTDEDTASGGAPQE